MDKFLSFFQGELFLVIAGFLYVVVEYWLGKTTLVKPGSVLEGVLSGVKKVLELLKIKKPSA